MVIYSVVGVVIIVFVVEPREQYDGDERRLDDVEQQGVQGEDESIVDAGIEREQSGGRRRVLGVGIERKYESEVQSLQLYSPAM